MLTKASDEEATLTQMDANSGQSEAETEVLPTIDTADETVVLDAVSDADTTVIDDVVPADGPAAVESTPPGVSRVTAPVEKPSPASQPATPQPTTPPAPVAQSFDDDSDNTEPLAVWALALSVLGITFPAGIFLGHRAMKSIRATDRTGEPYAVAALWIGYAYLAALIGSILVLLIIS